MAHIEVADVGRLLILDARADLPLGQTLRHHVVADADMALKNEVHLRDLILLVENERVVVHSRIKLGRLQPEANVVEEAAAAVDVVNLEKAPEPVNDVVKEIGEQNVMLDDLRHLMQVLLLFLDRFESIV